jgi:opacity protein-like surface antigen
MIILSRTRFLLIVVLTVSFLQASAQFTVSKYEVGVKGGVFVYQGDLAPSDAGSYKTLRPQFGVFVSRLLSSSFAARLNFDAGSLKGDDSKYSSPWWRQDRNFRFTSPLYELSAQLVWDVFARNYNRPVKSLSPYVFTGVGYTFISVHRDWSRMNTAVFTPESDVQAGLATDAAAANLKHGTVAFPVGVGLRYALTQKISLIGESSFRFIPTDYLDGFSYSANPSKNDHYYSHSLGAIYSFGKKNSWDCPVVRY